jgi:hypothetical protein
MNDFDYDCMQKKRIAMGAFAHINRKRGGCSLPSDTLTEKQRKEKNGEVKSYNITRPMPWHEFKGVPDDLKREYLRNMQSCGAAATYLADEMGCCSATIREYGEKLGAPFARGGRNFDLWQKKLSEWHTAEVTEEETPEKQTDEIEPPARGEELLHARLTIRGDRESVLQNLRMLMLEECEITVER